jgi:hypothetical protein
VSQSEVRKLFTLSDTRVLFVVLVLVVVLPVVCGLVFMPGLGNYWVERFYGPELERDFGFRAGQQTIPFHEGQVSAFVLTWVDPEGCLGRAGLKAGDMPRTYHGSGDFWGPLLRLRDGETIELTILPEKFRQQGWQARREIRIGPCTQPGGASERR